MNTPLQHIRPASASNLDFVAKAAHQVATFSPGGVLLPQQAMKFVELQIVESELLKRCNTSIIPTAQYEIDKTGFTGQVLLPDEEDTAFPSDDLALAATDKVTLISKRYKAEIGITYDTVKRVIQGDNLMPYMTELLAKAALRDLEISALRGDTNLAATSKLNRLLKKQDGFLKLITSNVVDAAGSRLSLGLMDDARRLMPDEYFDQEGLEYLCTKNVRIDYESLIQQRATALGDAAFASKNDVKYKGAHAVNTVKTLPKDLTYNNVAKHTNMLFCNPGEQLMVGYLEEMTIRTAEDVRAGKFIAVLRFDVAFQVKHEQACVRIGNLRNQA